MSIEHDRRLDGVGADGQPPLPQARRMAPPQLDLADLPGQIWMRREGRLDVQRKLRVSLVDRCNFSCFFCHNEGQGPISRGRPDSLDLDTIVRMVHVAISEGATSVKLTGGEPLLYRSPRGRSTILDLVKSIAGIRDQNHSFDLSMTTNGSILSSMADRLVESGLDRVTISLSTMNPVTFTRFISADIPLMARIASSVDRARAVGLRPLKLNIPVFHSSRTGLGNLQEIGELIEFAVAHQVDEVCILTLISHENFSEFHEYYDFFSPTMRRELIHCLADHGIDSAASTVDMLARLGARFSDQLYPKIEFGVHLRGLKVSFETMRYGRFSNNPTIHQEGPYAMRISADGGLRTMLDSQADYSFIDAIRSGATDEFLGKIYRAAQEEIP